MFKKILALTLFLILFIVSTVSAGALFQYPKFKAFDKNGDPLSLGKLYTYIADTTTNKATYSNKILTSANLNPIILDANGEATVYGTGQYKFILHDADDNFIWSFNWFDSEYGYLGPNYFFADASLADQGVAVGSVTIKDFIDGLGAGEKATIALTRGSTGDHTDYIFLNSETIRSDIKLIREHGARISVAGGKIVTINSPFDPGFDQVFTGVGNIVFGSGAVKEVFTEWFAVVGDGVTDDISAFTKAAYSISTIGGIIRLAPKTYVLSTTWTLYNGITVQGMGQSKSVLKKAATQTTPIITVDGLTGVHICDLKLDGNKTNQAISDDNRMGIKANDAVNLTIENCYITATGHAGIYTRNTATDIKIINNTINNCGQEAGSTFPGLYLTGIDGVSDSISVIGNHFENNLYALGIRSGGGLEANNIALRQVRVIGNSFLDNAMSIMLSHTEDSVISNNTFYNDEVVRAAGGNAIDFQGFCENININGNAFVTTDITYHVIQVANDVTDINVIGNSLDGGAYGILVSGAGTANVIVEGNNIKNSNTTGIVVDTAASGVVINGNILTDDTANTTNISVQNASTDVIVTNNIVKGTGGAGAGIVFAAAPTNCITHDNIIEGFAANWIIHSFTDADTTPDVSVGRIFATNNTTGATTISMFDGGRAGQQIIVYFGDANTTIDFTGTNLEGNAGADFTGAVDDFLEAWFNGVKWFCEVHDTTA